MQQDEQQDLDCNALNSNRNAWWEKQTSFAAAQFQHFHLWHRQHDVVIKSGTTQAAVTHAWLDQKLHQTLRGTEFIVDFFFP